MTVGLGGRVERPAAGWSWMEFSVTNVFGRMTSPKERVWQMKMWIDPGLGLWLGGQKVQVTELTAPGAKLDSEQVVAVPDLKAV